MASTTYNISKSGVMDGTIDLDSGDIRAALVMTNTTVDTEIDVNTISGFTTLDEGDATGYSRVDMTGLTVTTNDTDDRGDFDTTADIEFSGMSGDASRAYQGALFYLHVTDDTDSVPICFCEFDSTQSSAATKITVPTSTTNILQAS